MTDVLITIIEFASNFGMLLALGFLFCCLLVAAGIFTVAYAFKLALPMLREAANEEKQQELKEAQNDADFLEAYKIYKKQKK